MNNYVILFANFVNGIVPYDLWKPRMIAWVNSLIAPLQLLNGDFQSFVSSVRYKMYLTGQVIYLEHYLNDLFDASERRIYISDSLPALAPFLYNKVDGEHLTIYNKSEGQAPVYLYTKEDLSGQNDFIINVPAVIPVTANLEKQIEAAVERYKQAGARYLIQNF